MSAIALSFCADAMAVEDDGPNGVGLVAVAKTADEKSYAQSQRCRRVRALLDRLTNKIFDLAGALADDLRGVGGRILGLAVQVLNGAFYLARLALQLAFQISGRPSGRLLDLTAKIFGGARQPIFIHDSILYRSFGADADFPCLEPGSRRQTRVKLRVPSPRPQRSKYKTNSYGQEEGSVGPRLEGLVDALLKIVADLSYGLDRFPSLVPHIGDDPSGLSCGSARRHGFT
jgi:hypothetical protein